MTIPVDYITIELTGAEEQRRAERAELQQMAADLAEYAPHLGLATLAPKIVAELTDEQIRWIVADAICALVARWHDFTFAGGTVRWASLKPAEDRFRQLHAETVPSWWHEPDQEE
jgi:hypothetical protein